MSTLNKEFVPPSLSPQLMSNVCVFVSLPSASLFSLPIFTFNTGNNFTKCRIKVPMERQLSQVWSSKYKVFQSTPINPASTTVIHIGCIHTLLIHSKVQDKTSFSVKCGQKQCDALEWGLNDCTRSSFALDKHKMKTWCFTWRDPSQVFQWHMIILKH